MILLKRIENNKGTVSSSLGKEIAKEILEGDTQTLLEAIPLTTYDSNSINGKNIRASAAKIIEQVAEKRPDLVAEHLDALLLALYVKEPQTKWMIFRTLGFCAKLNSNMAQKGIAIAKELIREKQDGQLCLVGAIDLYLGDYGSVSKETAAEVYPILLESSDNVIQNEHDWILEAFIRIAKHLSSEKKQILLKIANEFGYISKKATQDRIKKLIKECKD